MTFSGFDYLTEAQKASAMITGYDRIAHALYLFLVESKFIGLFSILFGISFWLFLDRARARGGPATLLFYRRIGWLFLFGALHGWLLWCFDILRFYALWAILLPLFVRMPLRRLLAVALSMAVLAPAVIAGVRVLLEGSDDPRYAYDALWLAIFSTGDYFEVLAANWKLDWLWRNSLGELAYQLAIFGRLLLGLYVARALNLANLDGHRALLEKILVIGAIVGAAGNLVSASHFLADAEGFVLPFLRRLIVNCGFLGFTLAYASGLALLFLNLRWKAAVLVLAPIGQMALTWYLLQTVFGIWLFYGFVPGGPHLMGKVGPAWLTLIWVVGFAVQIGLAHAWMRRFRFGPAEWLWRTLTYWQVQPLKSGTRTEQPGR
ncbi:MAG: DUF418 domain-containing protein [Gemmatimonadota bacterium]|nr:DUF418 domain-containing protein [Gemmatimonadota bacterium]